MTIYATERSLTSSVTPEYAYRADNSGIWKLSWLSDRSLNRMQALAGMELDELLSSLDLVDDEDAYRHIADHAASLGMDWWDVVVRRGTGLSAACADTVGGGCHRPRS